MPAKSAKQQRFMAAVANNPQFAKQVGVPQNVGEEFMKKKYAGGGMPMVRGKDGKMIPEFAADGKGKMMGGGMVKKRYKEGGGVKENIKSALINRRTKPLKPGDIDEDKIKKIRMDNGYKNGGKVRGCGAVSKKMRPAKMVSMKGS